MATQVLPAPYDSFTRGRRDAIEFQNLIEQQRQRALMFPLEMQGKQINNDYMTGQSTNIDLGNQLKKGTLNTDIFSGNQQNLTNQRSAESLYNFQGYNNDISRAMMDQQTDPTARARMGALGQIPNIAPGMAATNTYNPAPQDTPEMAAMRRATMHSMGYNEDGTPLQQQPAPPFRLNNSATPNMAQPQQQNPQQPAGAQTFMDLYGGQYGGGYTDLVPQGAPVPMNIYDPTQLNPDGSMGASSQSAPNFQLNPSMMDNYGGPDFSKTGVPQELIQFALETDRMNNLQPGTTIAQYGVESSFGKNNVGPVTPYGQAIGPMQFTEETMNSLNKTSGQNLDRRDPMQALMLHRQLLEANKKYIVPGNDPTTEALQLYYAGPDRDIWGKNTAAYPLKVRDMLQRFSGGGGGK